MGVAVFVVAGFALVEAVVVVVVAVVVVCVAEVVVIGVVERGWIHRVRGVGASSVLLQPRRKTLHRKSSRWQNVLSSSC